MEQEKGTEATSQPAQHVFLLWVGRDDIYGVYNILAEAMAAAEFRDQIDEYVIGQDCCRVASYDERGVKWLENGRDIRYSQVQDATPEETARTLKELGCQSDGL